MKNVTLVIMAAGLGSRFKGGIKALEPVGPNGEIIMDYSVHDAVEAGFNKVVFVIRKEMEKEFEEVIGQRIRKKVNVEYAFQDVKDIPEKYQEMFKDRTKPWGTGHAVMACKDIVKEPFVVCNADDYYGKEAYQVAYKYLCDEHKYTATMMVGFRLKNTLSENGTVTRGICVQDENNYLTHIVETYNVDYSYPDLDSLCSMNMWGFQPEFITEILEPGFEEYLSTITDPNAKGEYLLPTIIGGLLKKEAITVKVLKSHDTWYGVTYKEDSPKVRASIKALHDQGLYPEKL